MTQCMTHLAHKREGGSSDLQDPGKSCPVVAATDSSSAQEADRAGPACYLDQLELVSARFSKRSCLKIVSGKQWEKIPSVNFWPLHVCTHICIAHMDIHILVNIHTCMLHMPTCAGKKE